MAFELPFPPFPHDSRDVPFIATPDDENGYTVPSSQYFKKLVGDKYIWTPVSADDPMPTSDVTAQGKLADILAKLSADPTTQTTLAAILAKIIAAPASEAKQEAIELLLGSIDGKDYSTLAKQNEILTKLAALETKLNSALDVQLSGSKVEIGGVTFEVSGGDTLRGKSADKPDAVAAHAVIPYCFYFSIDTGTVEATDGTNWVVI